MASARRVRVASLHEQLFDTNAVSLPTMRPTELPGIPQHYTKTIARRSFSGRCPAGPFDVELEFGEPAHDVPVVDGWDWRCPMRLTVGLEVTERSIMGVDSLQALTLAMGVARTELEIIATRPDTVLCYLDEPIDTARAGWQQALV